MSLPSFININSDNFLSNENLIQDVNNAYLLSLKETSGLSEKSSGVNLRDDAQPTAVEAFENFVDFKPEVRDKLTQEGAATISAKTANVCKVLRNSVVESHVRNSVQFNYNSTERLYNPVTLRSEVHTQLDLLREHALAPWNFDKLPGNNPQSWPIGLDALNERLASLPELNFFYEPFDLSNSFKTKSRQFIDDTIARLKKEESPSAESEDVKNLVAALNAILSISFHTGSFSEIMNAIKLLNDISEDLVQMNLSITEQLHVSFGACIEKIKAYAQSTTHLHHLDTFCDEGGFKVPKVTYFQKQSFFNTSVATDGAYVYIYVSSSNGGMYKIGTGEQGTVAGRIYAFAGINKMEEVSWVYCKGKLYLRNSSKEMGTLEIICTETFKVEGCLQIYCPDIFGHPSLQLINKNYPLLTDGEHVYIIGKKLISEKINNEPPKTEEQKAEEAAKKEEAVKKEEAAAVALKDEKSEEEKPKEAAELIKEKKEEPEVSESSGVGSRAEIKDVIPAEKIEDALVPPVKAAEEKSVAEEAKPAEAEAEAEEKVPVLLDEKVPVLLDEKVPDEKPAEEKPAEEKPAEEKPAEEKPAEEKPAEDKQVEAQPVPVEEKEKKSEKKDKEKKMPQRKEMKKEPRKKKNETKKVQENENEQTLKLCEFILYEFDITDTKGLDFIDQSEIYDKELIQELYESFNGYFTFNECARALSYNKDDIQNAAQWLVDEGDRERSKKTVLVKNTTLLAQAEVTSDISSKNLKNNVELVTKEDSIIFPNNVSMNIWTMDKTHVALYCESGVKIFSKNPKDVRVLSDVVTAKDNERPNSFEFKFGSGGSGGGFPPAPHDGYGGGGFSFGQTTASKPYTNTGGFLGGGGGFGQAPSGGFGQAPSGGFGQSTNVFGSTGGGFGGGSGAFGSGGATFTASTTSFSFSRNEPGTVPASNTGGIFGATTSSSGGVFDSGAAASSNNSGTGLFTYPSLFGGQPSNPPPFGQQQQQQQQPTTGTFLKAATKPATTGQTLPEGLRISKEEGGLKRSEFGEIADENKGNFENITQKSSFLFKDSQEKAEAVPTKAQGLFKAAPGEKKEWKDLNPNATAPITTAATTKVEKKINIELKGTYVKTLDKNKKAYYSNANFHVCYDPYNKRFFVFTWAWDAHTNIFPSLITMSYDPIRYQSSALHHVAVTPVKSLADASLQEYSNRLIEEVLLLQKNRFQLPNRLRNWDYLYGWALTDLNNKKGMLGGPNEEEKKKISAQKSKLIQRLSKVGSSEVVQKKDPEWKSLTSKNFIEVKKDYAFAIDGSLNSLKAILTAIKKREDQVFQSLNELNLDLLTTSGVYPYFNLLAYWTKHADVLINYKEKEPEEISEIENLLSTILTNDVHSPENFKKYPSLLSFNLLCWRILINGWQLYVRTSAKQFKWIQFILSTTGKYKHSEFKESADLSSECLNRDGFSPLVYFYVKYAHFPDSIIPEFPLKDYQIQMLKPTDIFDNIDEKGATNITRRSQVTKVREDNFVEPYGRLLIEDLSYLEYVKALPHQFEDLYTSYFINENKEVLKIDKAEQERIEKVEKEKAKAKENLIKNKNKKKPAGKVQEEATKSKKKVEKVVEPTKKTEKTETEAKKEDPERFKKIRIQKEIIQAHQQNSKKLLEAFEKSLSDLINNPTNENVLIWKIFTKLLYDTIVEYEKIDEGDIEWRYKLVHIERIFQFLDRVLENYSTKFSDALEKTPHLASKILENISTLISSVSYLAYQSSITKNFGCEEIAYTLIRLYAKIKKFIEFQDEKGQRKNILEHLITHNDEGVDHLNEKLIETNHPYERGRAINFDPLVFPGAIAISIEFDKRCQSDVSHDFISLTSGYDSSYSNNIGYFMNHREHIGTSFRISGKPNLKKPLVMLGNSLQADFAPSGQVKDEHSLSRWGFKLRVRPIYGVGNYILKDAAHNALFNSLQSKLGGEKSLTDFVTSLAILNLLTIEIIELYVRGTFLSDNEKQLKKYLKWNLFRGGISGVEISQLLSQKNDRYYSKIEKEYQDNETYSFDEKFDALREEIYNRIAKYSIKREVTKETEEEKPAQEKSITGFKDPMIASFIQDITSQNGQFHNLVTQLRNMVPIPMMLKAEKMRKTFLEEYKLMWDQAEGYLILAFLHHTGLLKFLVNDRDMIEVPVEPYIRDQLGQLGQRRNEVFNWMLHQIQCEREWQHTLEEISEFRNKHIDEKKANEEKDKKTKEEQEAEKKKEEEKNPKPAAGKLSSAAPSRGGFGRGGSKIAARPSSRGGSDYFKSSKSKSASRTNYIVDERSERRQTKLRRDDDESSEEEEEKEEDEHEEEEKVDADIVTAHATKDAHDFDEKLDETILKELSVRFEGHSDALKMVCSLKDIDVNKDSSQLLRDLYEICKANLRKFKKDPKNNHFILEFKSPYELIANNVIDTCQFLVKLNSPFKKGEIDGPESPSSKPEQGSINELSIGEDEDEPLQRPTTHRSFSSAPESQLSDMTAKVRLKGLRELVDAYQKWKEWHKKDVKESDDYYLLENASPVKSVVSLITAKVSSQKLEECLKNHVNRASQRIIGLQMMTSLFEHIINTPFERYLFGLLTQTFTEDYLSNVNCSPDEFTQLIESYSTQILDKFLVSFNNKMEAIKAIKLSHLNSLLSKTKGVSNGMLKWKSIIQQSLAGLSCNLRDIIAIISNAKIFKKLLNDQDSRRQEILKTFFENIFLLTLLCKSLSYLSLACEHLLTISNNCTQLVFYVMYLFQKLNNARSFNTILEIIADLFKKEIGLKKEGASTQYQLNARILQRAHDILIIERLQYLLTTTSNLLDKTDISKLNKNVLHELAFLNFTLTFHHNAPSIIRPSKRLSQQIGSHVDFMSLPTPYDISYYYYHYGDYENMQKAAKTQTNYKFEPNELVYKTIEAPKLESSASELNINNGLALIEKIGDKILMKRPEGVQIKNIVDNTLLKNEVDKSKNYTVLVHLANEEDLSFLLKVLYHWEEKYPTFTLKHPKNVEEYHKYKEHLTKKEADKAKTSNEKIPSGVHPVSESYFKDNEKIFANLPHHNLITKDEEDLPIAWMFNTLSTYSDCKAGRIELKKSKTRKTVRKVWNNVNLNKLEKKMEEAFKSIEEFKEEDTEEVKSQVIKARTFAWRIQQHLKEALYIAAMLNIFGFSPILDPMPFEKAQELATMINLGLQKKLKNISVAHFEKEEIRKKLDPHSLQGAPQPSGKNKPAPATTTTAETDKDHKSEMVISFAESRYVPYFETNMDFITGLNVPKESLYVDCNKIPVIHNAILQGSSTTILVDELINYVRSLLKTESVSAAVLPQIQKVIDTVSNKHFEDLTSLEKSLFVGITAVIGGWTDTVKLGPNIVLEGAENSQLVMTQGGYLSGKKNCNILSKNESSLVPQTVPLERLHPHLEAQLPDSINIHPRAIINCFKLLHESFDKQKDKPEDQNLETSILLRAILRVSKALDWNRLIQDNEVNKEDLSHFLNFLLKLGAHVPADKSQEFYESAFGKAWERLIDKYEPKNHIFFFPTEFSTEKSEFETDEPSAQMDNLKKRESQGPIVVENLLPNSNYISSLPEYKPLVSEYKMLKYWEKHIIPKIQDFVRSSYKPYEFEEFFEQLRQPLRKGDQAKAAEIAYILCDQRLPNGCVLPDANHDWSTISVEEIVLGTWATVHISNKQNKPVSPFFQSQHRIGNKDAAVYLIAVDTKSSSVLVNYYDHQNLQMVTVWVPVASLKVPEVPLDLPPASYPMSKIQENFRHAVVDSMAFLARGTILKFFSFNSTQTEQFKKEADLMRSYSFSTVNLIRWSVLEELADDPLEGWLKINEWEIQLNEKPKKGSAQNASDLINEAVKEEAINKAPKLQALKGLLKYLGESDTHNEIDDILTWLNDNFSKLVDFINMNAAQFDLQRPYAEAVIPPHGSSSKPIYYLNNCLPDVPSDDTIAALTVSFKKESSLCMNSGIKFYNDPKGVNIIQHLPAGGEARTKLPSLMFKQSQIWFSYYFNSEAIPPYLLSQCFSTLQAVVHAIPSRWSVCLWTADALSTVFLQAKTMKSYEQMRRLISIVVDALQQFKGPLSVKNFIYKFLNRCARKMRYLINSLPELKPQINIKSSDAAAKENFRLLNVDTKWLKTIIEEIQNLREFQASDVITLYSSYSQELIEYVVNCLLPVSFFEKTSLGCSAAVNELNVPDWLRCVIDTALFLQFFKGESEMTEDLLKDTINNMKLDSQWDKFIYIEDLPTECSKAELVEKIKDIILQSKGRILNPKIDIYLPSTTDENGNEKHLGKCLVLIDGWSAFDLEEEEEKEAEPEPVEEEEPQEPELWSCPTCTLENARESPFCDACETPKPAYVRKPAEAPAEEEVKHTDLAEIDQKMKQKQKERFEKISEQIREYIDGHYEKMKQRVQEIEDSEKAKLEKPAVATEASELQPEKKESEVDAVEARREKNRKKKQELKEAKKKLQEEKQQKRQDKKKNKKGGVVEEKAPATEVVEEEKKEEIVEEKPAAVEEEKKEEVVPEVKVEEKKPSAEEEEKKKLQELINNQKKPSIIAAEEVVNSPQSSQVFQDFLKLRLLTSTTGDLTEYATKVLTKVFNQLQASADRIVPQYQKTIQDIDVSDIKTVSVTDFIARISSEARRSPIKVFKLLEACGYDLWLYQAHFNLVIEAQNDVKLLPLNVLEQLMNFLQLDLCKENKTVLNYPPVNIRIPHPDAGDTAETKPINYDEETLFAVKYASLSKYNLAEIRFNWSIIKTFNRNLAEAIDFLSTLSAIPYNFSAKWFNLGTYLSAFRNLWMTPIKIELSQKIMAKTAIARDHVPKVTIERLKNFSEKEKQATNVAVSKEIVSYKIREDFIFTKAYEQLKEVSTTLFRPVKPSGSDPFLAFEIIFKGELAMGEAGPYRQFFADISQELQPNNVSLATQYKNLNLLVPSPNNYAKLGEGRDNFVINPSAKSTYHLQLFEFLGILMGCSVRTGTHLTLDLPTLFWKQLVNQPISIEDLEEIDKPLTDLIRFMGECTKDVFEDSFFENYTTMLSDKSIVELKAGGSKTRVRFEDRFDYISKVLEVRVNESKLQIEAIRRGLTQLVPLPYINIISAFDLEIWVCGKSKVDVSLLKRHTRYSGGLNEEVPTIKYLWEVLQELSDTEKLRFVKFCWGQERLPANDEEFERTQTRFMIKPSTLPEASHDRALPKADTCFFNLELPRYSTKQILKDKLLLAINTDCDSINADQLINLDPNAHHHRGGNDFEEIAEDDDEE